MLINHHHHHHLLFHMQVVAGQVIAVVEAMKMQNSLVAPRDGVVKSVNFKGGDKVGDSAVVIELEKEEKKGQAEEDKKTKAAKGK
jgi:pyruvate/2-oxoglutarate dehydrogenase complex dihydrolipoamide acyltransferase (E2) component